MPIWAQLRMLIVTKAYQSMKWNLHLYLVIYVFLNFFNSQAQQGTRDIQKLDFENIVFTPKKPKFMIFDMLTERPIIPYCVIRTSDNWMLFMPCSVFSNYTDFTPTPE